MNISYLMYQAERPRTAAEQREEDVRTGQLAAAAAQVGRAVRAVVNRHSTGIRHHGPVIPGDDLIPMAGSRR